MSCEIELQIGAGATAGEFTARVVHAASGGEPAATMQLDVDTLLRNRDILESTVLASSVSARRLLPAAEQQLRGVGKQLFDSLFTGPIYGAYRASMGVAQQRGERLRVVLRLTAPELAALPWEALFDTETETYICRKEPLVRHVPAPYTPDPLQVEPPLKVLGLVASPRGLPMLDVSAEQAHLTEALAGPIAEGLIDLHWLPNATWDGVHAMLLSDEWHVMHFVGHGDFSVENDQGLIALVDADGRADLVEAERLADLLGEAQPTPRLVVLNSCSSGESGTQDLFSGTAAALVRSGISAVAAMQFTVSDAAAIAFARGFYTAIAHGRAVDEATRSGRIAILGAPHTLEWVTPVLYLRGDTAQLFDLHAPRGGAAGKRATAQDELEERQHQLHEMYMRARAELRARRFDTAVGLLDDLHSLDPDYRDTAQLRREAARQLQLANLYQRATNAQAFGDWATAVQVYGEILDADAGYRDAAARRERCQRSQQIADLQEELRYHVDVGDWQAAVEVSDEIAALDATAANPDGMADRAREELEAETLAHELASRYRQARAAEDAQRWLPAAEVYAAIIELDPSYRDAAARREGCLRRQHVAELLSEAEAPPAAQPVEGRDTGRQERERRPLADRIDPRWLAGALVLTAGIQLLSYAASNLNSPANVDRYLKAPDANHWLFIPWLLPSAPMLVAAWLLARRRKTGIALGCIATAFTWVAISWGYYEWQGDISPWAGLFPLAVLGAVSVVIFRVDRTWRPAHLNGVNQALTALVLMMVAVILRLLADDIAYAVGQQVPSPIRPEASFVDVPPGWAAVVIPLVIGLPAIGLRRNELVTPALKTLTWFLVAYDVVLHVVVRIVQLEAVADSDVREVWAMFGGASVLYLVGSFCLVWAVSAGQRQPRSSREESRAE